MIAVLCGGVGAARFLRALAGVVPPANTVGIVNTGDDTVLHGLYVAPDLDTVTYTLAGAIDDVRGWGLRDETWTAMAALARYAAVRPEDSAAAPTWFNLGDRDLATHFFRTARLAEGASLSQVTREITAAWGLGQRLVPMSDDRVSTTIALAPDGREVSFQEYFVRLRHEPAVAAVRFDGAAQAALTPEASAALADADMVAIAPSNPLVSIGPIRALRGVNDALARRRDSVVAVSPIVGGVALKGPADRMLADLGHEPSVVGVARLYAPVASVLVIDPADEVHAGEVAAAGMRPLVVPSVMSDPAVAHELARQVVRAGRG